MKQGVKIYTATDKRTSYYIVTPYYTNYSRYHLELDQQNGQNVSKSSTLQARDHSHMKQRQQIRKKKTFVVYTNAQCGSV